PYFSAWSTTDQLFDDQVRHWTGQAHPLIGALRVDGVVYRFRGKENVPLEFVLPMARGEAWEGQYTTQKPSGKWQQPKYDAKSWAKGKGAFGSQGTPLSNTLWDTKDVWVRREFTLPAGVKNEAISLIYSHDDIFELYLNGKQLVATDYVWNDDVILSIDSKLLNAGGKNVIAAHCHNKEGGAYVDFGLIRDPKEGEVFKQLAIQKSVSLSATQTHYQFTCGPVDLNLDFVSPLLPSNLDVLSRPINYINYAVASTDGKDHEVQVYFEATPEWAVHQVNQEVEVNEGQTSTINYVKAGTTEQPILQKKGDNVRIDWGHFFLASHNSNDSQLEIGKYTETKNNFVSGGNLLEGKEHQVAYMPTAMPVLAYANDLGSVSANAKKDFIMVAYDDIESIQYFNINRKAWWTKGGTVTIEAALASASKEHADIMKQCNTLDAEMYAETFEAGGDNYSKLCILAFRQSIAAHKLITDTDGNIVFLSKENFSNGSIGTVDLTYPSAPLYLRYNTELLKGMMNPIFYYSESGKWTKPFAAHDVGTYPQANGQTYGTDMPIEESGNMLILAAAIAQQDGNALYAEQHWDVLTIWANYLIENGLDPSNQLCTDDFAGHSAHNSNLSIKAIMGIASYGYVANMLGKDKVGEQYLNEAKELAKKWMVMADDGDHYRLAFDTPNSWSQKYNLVWDKILDLGIFPDEVAEKEMAYYLTKQNKYG
ncbi:MAG: DUF4965 domain-containing protein, partial [Bacteroidales bacterium]|nr:DUF4965 domain-containing protein [Bacteroidales bacterium]